MNWLPRSMGAWAALAMGGLAIWLLIQGRLLDGPAAALAALLLALFSGRPTRKRVAFALAAIALATLLPVILVAGLDLYLHHRYAVTGGYNIWGYRGQSLGRKAPGERRIAVLGGSTAFGYGVKSNEAYPAQLESLLNSPDSDRSRTPVTVANLAWNGEGAYSFRFTLEDYDYLDPDVVLLYSGYNDLSLNRVVFRRQSAIFRRTGYLPILPIVSASWFRRPDLDLSATRNQTFVFTPGLAEHSAAQATDLALGLTQMLERELQRIAPDQGTDMPQNRSAGDCGRWSDYCHSLSEAVRYALDRGRHVVVISEPYLGGGTVVANGQFEQQNAVRRMLTRQFSGETRLHYLNMGRTVNLTDTTLAYDGMHLTVAGNKILAQALAAGVHAILAGVENGRFERPASSRARYPLDVDDRMAIPLLQLGKFEAAYEEARHTLAERPNDKRAADELASAALQLGDIAGARTSLDAQTVNGLDDAWTHETLYRIGAATADHKLSDREIAWSARQPDQYRLLSAQADVAAAGGRFALARALQGEAIKEASRRGRPDVAAVFWTRQAVFEALVGNHQRATEDVAAALALHRGPNSLWASALTLALAGQPGAAKALVDEYRRASGSDGLVENLWQPILEASLQLAEGNSLKALEQLEGLIAYERTTYWPRYLRGLAHLKMGNGYRASLEFAHILSQPVLAPTDLVYVMAQRQFARASSLGGGGWDLSAIYRAFFDSWEGADPDVPLVKEVREEYEDLQDSIGLKAMPGGVWHQSSHN